MVVQALGPEMSGGGLAVSSRGYRMVTGGDETLGVMTTAQAGVTQADSPDLVIAKRLLDHLKVLGFQFQRTAQGEDGALVGYRKVMTTWISSTSKDLVEIALLGESAHHR